MAEADLSLVCERYADVFGASIQPSHRAYFSQNDKNRTLAMLGYTRARDSELFLERYLDAPVEQHIARAFGCNPGRDRIVELGNLAACDGNALVRLWGRAANDLGSEMEFAVATLTAPLRAMFRRIGLPIRVLAPATFACASAESWGSYYDHDPQVCAGRITEGQQAIDRFLARRQRENAA